jgi:hypothetical protein
MNFFVGARRRSIRRFRRASALVSQTKTTEKRTKKRAGQRQKEKKEHSMSYNGTININFIGWRRFVGDGFFIHLSLSLPLTLSLSLFPPFAVSIQKNIIIFMLYSE